MRYDIINIHPFEVAGMCLTYLQRVGTVALRIKFQVEAF
jgi:hypothetical protein